MRILRETVPHSSIKWSVCGVMNYSRYIGSGAPRRAPIKVMLFQHNVEARWYPRVELGTRGVNTIRGEPNTVPITEASPSSAWAAMGGVILLILIV
jgi:hypothetical protein